jgi:subtilisin family serine protease
MCAYDVGIAGPEATLLDVAVFARDASFQVHLLDAIKAYEHLGNLLRARPEDKRALVITNSWGLPSPSADLPVADPGNYSDNPNHPFSVQVASLELAGADILFATGNCGRDCPVDGCDAWGKTLPLAGANSHPRVISVAGVDVHGQRVGYSTQGPGRLTAKKPDIATYTHFVGSGVHPSDKGGDNGTSAACPVAAGVIAAIRSRYPKSKVSPSQLRSIIQRTAQDRGAPGHDADYGWGILDPRALAAALLVAIPP